jgi:hypothetical protein
METRLGPLERILKGANRERERESNKREKREKRDEGEAFVLISKKRTNSFLSFDRQHTERERERERTGAKEKREKVHA